MLPINLNNNPSNPSNNPNNLRTALPRPPRRPFASFNTDSNNLFGTHSDNYNFNGGFGDHEAPMLGRPT